MQESRYLTYAEQVSAACREIYTKYGYRRYKMSRFEEYDLYAANRNFLASENIITFNSPSGRLMALKPDITLSIVKNAECSGCPEKVFYIESVYRTARGTSEFRELMQLGLEYIGDVGLYQMGEVIALAAMSLEKISRDFILDLSHMGYISALIEAAGLPTEARDGLVFCIGGRNADGIRAICEKSGAKADMTRRLVGLTEVYGSFYNTIAEFERLSVNEKSDAALEEIRGIYRVLEAFGCAGQIHLDFSHIGDMNYYNGVTFCGYVSGIPFALLSGGRYDSLLENFGKSGGAIGFAIYLDQLDALPRTPVDGSRDIVIICDKNDADTAARCASVVRRLTEEGYCVSVGGSNLPSGAIIMTLDEAENRRGI